jgi:PPK2 family polyphosphate:nucleotide phosphotransferase
MKLKPIDSDTPLRLGDKDAHPPKGALAGKELETAIDKHTRRISDLQRVLYADARWAVLIVLQGRDASGKDGTIRHVFSAVNPQGCDVASFKAPTEDEARHDFLWRIHARVPARGMIGIFNRSHYEDVLVPRVAKRLPKKKCRARYDQINDFERMLVANQVVILKFFLHVSRDEQRRRLAERLSDPTKNWKFRAGDLDDRARWKEYTAAYRDLLSECSTPDAPWYVVPADDNKVRNWLVARCIADRLDDLGLEYPRADRSITGLKVE